MWKVQVGDLLILRIRLTIHCVSPISVSWFLLAPDLRVGRRAVKPEIKGQLSNKCNLFRRDQSDQCKCAYKWSTCYLVTSSSKPIGICILVLKHTSLSCEIRSIYIAFFSSLITFSVLITFLLCYSQFATDWNWHYVTSINTQSSQMTSPRL